jgi:hypothetical protein
MAFYRCIFCLHRHTIAGGVERSREHVFPDALGGRFVVPYPCTGCNNALGANVDNELVTHLLSQARRHELNLVPEDTPHPFLSGKGTIESDGTQVLTTTTKAGMENKLVPKKTLTKNSDGSQSLTLAADANDIPAIKRTLERFFSQAGQPIPTDEALDEIIAGAAQGSYVHPRIAYSIPIGAYPDRALVKIVYEFACHWLGVRWFRNDPIAREMRRFILTGVERVPGQLTGATDEWPESIKELLEAHSVAHAAILPMKAARGADIRIFIRVFDRFYAWLVVSRDPGAYPNLPDNGIVVINEPGKAYVVTALDALVLELITRRAMI